MKFNKSMVLEGAHSLERIKSRVELYMDELRDIQNKMAYLEGDFEIIENISRNIADLDKQRNNIVSIIAALHTIVNYYDKCEEDNVLECYDEKITYSQKECGLIDLTVITNSLIDIGVLKRK